VITVILAGLAAAQTGPTVSVAKTEPPADLAPPLRDRLDPEALTVSDGRPMLSVWFAASIPVKATAEQLANGLTYREIPDGTLLGVVRFDRPFVDNRKQEVAAGVYTLRFAVQPDIGDHKDTAPYQDFALLTPAAKDRSPEPVEVEDLVKQSAAATGGDHPAVMLLWPHRTAGKPGVADRGDGVKVLTTYRPVDADGTAGTLGFALTVAGHSRSR
jgi:hypothetical protein